MANKFFGEATVTDDSGKKYTLRLDFNAMCEFEEATGKDAMEAFSDFEKGRVSVRLMRSMMLAFLKHHHPDATAQQAGDILSENLSALETVMSAAMPTQSEVADLGKQKARGQAG
jgi:hypothetical protein